MVVMKVFLGLFLFLISGYGWCEDDVTNLPPIENISIASSENRAVAGESAAGETNEVVAVPTSPFIKIKLGEAEFSGLLNVLYSHDPQALDTFAIKRAELQIKGSLNPSTEYTIMIDPAKKLDANGDNKILQELRLGLKGALWGYPLKLTLGQVKIPVTLEGLQSSSALETIDRATIVRNTGDKRDQGVLVDGAINPAHLKYTLGVFNGEGPNVNDKNDHKDVAGRLVWEVPYVQGLNLGASLYEGKQGAKNVDKDRQGVELRYVHNVYLVKAEYLESTNDKIDSNGWYGLVGYELDALDQIWSTNFFNKSQAVVRYETYDANVDDRASMDTLTVGLNHALQGNNSKLQVNYLRMDGRGGLADGEGLSVFYQIKF